MFISVCVYMYNNYCFSEINIVAHNNIYIYLLYHILHISMIIILTSHKKVYFYCIVYIKFIKCLNYIICIYNWYQYRYKVVNIFKRRERFIEKNFATYKNVNEIIIYWTLFQILYAVDSTHTQELIKRLPSLYNYILYIRIRVML